ncbi:hypothetical protein RJT34_29659 [Clitoria ternatea]|uniref:Cystatin domain-containing protein n=1 Tax=Clitoria ternatea TaxID=43366 RepID=A0AAN9ES20_CLITE
MSQQLKMMKVIVLFLVVVPSAIARKEGDWIPIKNINDPKVIGMATFVVNTYDDEMGETLKLEKVIRGETHVLLGTSYRLILSVTNASSSSTIYEARVWTKPTKNDPLFKMLIDFFTPPIDL